MIDLHCHLPFGIGDGPKSIDDSLRMLRCAADSGVTRITAVAHYDHNFDKVAEAVEAMRPEAEKLGVELFPSFEYDYIHLDNVKAEEMHFIGPESRYILVDFNRERIPYAAPMRFFELSEQGVGVIVVHPEKLFSRAELPLLKKLSEGGIALQINALSLLSEASRDRRSMAHWLIRHGLVHAVASDAHRPEGHRRYVMTEARKIVVDTYGGELAQLLFDENPARLLKNLTPVDPSPFPTWWERFRHRWFGR